MLLRQWLDLEGIYAPSLAHQRYRLTQEEEVEVQGIIAGLLAEFQSCNLPPAIEVKPEEYDVVILLRALPEHDLPVGSRGTVVIDHTQYDRGMIFLPLRVRVRQIRGNTQDLETLCVDAIEVAPACR